MIIYEFPISQNQDFTFFRFVLEISSIFRCGHGFCITILLPICCWRLVKNWIFGNATIQNTQKNWEKIKNIKNHDFGILEIVRTTYLSFREMRPTFNIRKKLHKTIRVVSDFYENFDFFMKKSIEFWKFLWKFRKIRIHEFQAKIQNRAPHPGGGISWKCMEFSELHEISWNGKQKNKDRNMFFVTFHEIILILWNFHKIYDDTLDIDIVIVFSPI